MAHVIFHFEVNNFSLRNHNELYKAQHTVITVMIISIRKVFVDKIDNYKSEREREHISIINQRERESIYLLSKQNRNLKF